MIDMDSEIPKEFEALIARVHTIAKVFREKFTTLYPEEANKIGLSITVGPEQWMVLSENIGSILQRLAKYCGKYPDSAETFAQEVTALAEIIIQSPEPYWDHNVSHFFLSLLADPILQPAAYLIFEAAVDRYVHPDYPATNSHPCFDRLLMHIVDFNDEAKLRYRAYAAYILADKFPFRPKVEIFQKLRQARLPENRVTISFMLIEDAQSLSAWKTRIGTIDLQRDREVELQRIFGNEGEAAAKLYMQKAANPDNFLPIWRKLQGEITRGLFVDVGGTLLLDNDRLNRPLVAKLIEVQQLGVNITVFTHGDPQEMSHKLSRLGFPENLLPVTSKENFKGQYLERTIDDAPPASTYYGAGCYFLPAHITNTGGPNYVDLVYYFLQMAAATEIKAIRP